MIPSHIYWFAHYNMKGPCVRYRGKYFLEAMKYYYGVPYSFVVPGYAFLNILHFIHVFFSAFFFRKRNSLIVFQKIYTRGIYAHALKFLLVFRKEMTIYDLDDAYYIKFPSQTIRHFLKHAAIISVGSTELFNYSSLFNHNIFINSSPVIPHQCIKERKNGIFTIGWIGFYNAHRESMERLFLPALMDIDIRLKLVIMGVTRNEHKESLREFFSLIGNVELEIPEDIEWENEMSVYKRISQFDIGVAPLLDTEINKAKSAFKLKQYLSSGIPVLASPVGENCHFLKDGFNGFFCNGPADFGKRIEHMYNLPGEAYHQLSYQALQSASEFSMEKYCKSFLSHLNHSSS